jgi:DNA/RNA-binding domain of Phe-tRNA-synthetase-like protein
MSGPCRGTVDAVVAVELPGLTLVWMRVAARTGSSPPGARERLALLAQRTRGVDAVALRTRPVVAAYRALYRQMGLDPDSERVAAEQLALERLLGGGLTPRDPIADACRIALAETHVPVLALDGSRVHEASLGIRNAAGSLVIADARRVHATLTGRLAAGSGPGRATREVVLVCVGAPGVPAIAVEEALWTAAEILGA